MEKRLSHEAEEYIETIYKLQKRSGIAKTKDLAKAMHVVPGSVTNTIDHLESHGLVIHKPYYGVRLTRKGERIALDVIRKHRLAECFLNQLLMLEWSDVHEEACKLEHALTQNVTDLLDEKLGFPKVCPHGNPIPSKNGAVEEQPCFSLIEAVVGKAYIVSNIIDEDQSSLQFLANAKIKPDAVVQVVKFGNDEAVLSVEGHQYHLAKGLAASVLLKKPGENNRAT